MDPSSSSELCQVSENLWFVVTGNWQPPFTATRPVSANMMMNSRRNLLELIES